MRTIRESRIPEQGDGDNGGSRGISIIYYYEYTCTHISSSCLLTKRRWTSLNPFLRLNAGLQLNNNSNIPIPKIRTEVDWLVVEVSLGNLKVSLPALHGPGIERKIKHGSPLSPFSTHLSLSLN